MARLLTEPKAMLRERLKAALLHLLSFYKEFRNLYYEQISVELIADVARGVGGAHAEHRRRIAPLERKRRLKSEIA